MKFVSQGIHALVRAVYVALFCAVSLASTALLQWGVAKNEPALRFFAPAFLGKIFDIGTKNPTLRFHLLLAVFAYLAVIALLNRFWLSTGVFGVVALFLALRAHDAGLSAVPIALDIDPAATMWIAISAIMFAGICIVGRIFLGPGHLISHDHLVLTRLLWRLVVLVGSFCCFVTVLHLLGAVPAYLPLPARWA